MLRLAAALVCVANPVFVLMLQALGFMSKQFGDAGPDASSEGAEIASFRKVHATMKYLAQHIS